MYYTGERTFQDMKGGTLWLEKHSMREILRMKKRLEPTICRGMGSQIR